VFDTHISNYYLHTRSFIALYDY